MSDSCCAMKGALSLEFELSDKINSYEILSFSLSFSPLYSSSLCIFICTAPSMVSIMHQVGRTVDSITLSWSQPDQPNGVILDYELQYYEKVMTMSFSLLSNAYCLKTCCSCSIFIIV